MESGAAIYLLLGLLLSVGFALGHVAERFGLPRIATYVATGAAFSEALLGRFIPGRPGQGPL